MLQTARSFLSSSTPHHSTPEVIVTSVICRNATFEQLLQASCARTVRGANFLNTRHYEKPFQVHHSGSFGLRGIAGGTNLREFHCPTPPCERWSGQHRSYWCLCLSLQLLDQRQHHAYSHDVRFLLQPHLVRRKLDGKCPQHSARRNVRHERTGAAGLSGSGVDFPWSIQRAHQRLTRKRSRLGTV